MAGASNNGRLPGWSGRLLLHSLDVVEQHSLVAFRLDLFIHLADHTLRIDHETATLPELHSFPFCLADAERLHQAGIGFGGRVDSKADLVSQILLPPNT